jgi:tripartite-type tricarboxylate transporter receptor subunit TctC
MHAVNNATFLVNSNGCIKMKKFLGFLCLLVTFFSASAFAQPYPNKPVKIIITYPVGGPADQIARDLAVGLTQNLGQSFVVEAKPGASGSIGTAFVAKAAPDGYTLLVGAGAPHTAVPVFSAKPPYDGVKEFTPILLIIDVPNVMVVAPHIKVNNVKEFIELAKTKPMTFASTGTGSSTHIAGEIFQIETKTKLTHVPYKGATPAITDMLGGHVDVSFLNLSAMLPHIQSGKLRAIGVTAPTRSKALPNVPTLLEQGVKDNTGSWYGLLAPSGIPEDIVKTLQNAAVKYFSQPEVRARIEAGGSELKLLDSKQFRAAMIQEKTELSDLNKILNLKIE